jgi:hypothetical protein
MQYEVVVKQREVLLNEVQRKLSRVKRDRRDESL